MTAPHFRHTLVGWIDPEQLYAAFYGDNPYSFWLDTGGNASAGVSYLGEGERLLWSDSEGVVRLGTVSADATGEGAAGIRDALLLPGTFLAELATRVPAPVEASGSAENPSFDLGWVGWIGYEEGVAELGLPTQPELSAIPASALLEVGVVVACDHASRQITLVARDEVKRDAWLRRYGDLYTRMVNGDEQMAVSRILPVPTASPLPSWRHSDSDYRALITTCQEQIRRGNAYQLCLTNRVTVGLSPPPFPLYQRLRASSPTHHGGLIRVGECSLVSATPEQFLAVTPRGVVRTAPIKGTRPRAESVGDDAATILELRGNAKERAENVMIVDLMRNDIQRVADIGSVQVTTLHRVETYAHVHQLVSTVEARLRRGMTAVDALRACFPAGSMTGAPKLSAMQILHSVEGGPRGIYAGVWGYLSDNGTTDLAMVIRSIMLDGNVATIGTGGGITIDSVIEAELAEIKIKAAAPLQALLGP
ncbi:hypothetical protein GCM10022198_04950 [Klugiella xanthotipulae]|uniref:Anthranilate synthase component 1 n=1 Tax=Klugiella xanthotipulae TaxID=244735 RepID=A0A543HSE9_9MICO|nr:anthranilate synthase component I family protein [Klugiella xanthotipulae]TQM61250.1 anthranilate synthase component 1 [Klugiella xanthotipulae]